MIIFELHLANKRKIKMTTWNYRVCKRTVQNYPEGVPPNMQPLIDNGTIKLTDIEYAIRAVHYEDNEQTTIIAYGPPVSLTTFASEYEHVSVANEGHLDYLAINGFEGEEGGLRWQLTKMLEALNKKVIDIDSLKFDPDDSKRDF